jgi:hypothetical protein
MNRRLLKGELQQPSLLLPALTAAAFRFGLVDAPPPLLTLEVKKSIRNNAFTPLP